MLRSHMLLEQLFGFRELRAPRENFNYCVAGGNIRPFNVRGVDPWHFYRTTVYVQPVYDPFDAFNAANRLAVVSWHELFGMTSMHDDATCTTRTYNQQYHGSYGLNCVTCLPRDSDRSCI